MWQMNFVCTLFIERRVAVLPTNYNVTYIANTRGMTEKVKARNSSTYALFRKKSKKQIQINQPTRCNNFSRLLLDVYLQLSMFRASSRPSSGAQQLQCCWSWSGQPARPRRTALLSPCSEGKTRGCYCSCWAPDDGRKDARNMLSCK